MPAKPRKSGRLSAIKIQSKSFEEPMSDDLFNRSVQAKRISKIKVETKPENPTSDEEFEVEKILDKRIVSGKVSVHLLNQYFLRKRIEINYFLFFISNISSGRILPQI